LPKRIVIAGGGYIAVEFAHVFAGLGAETTLVYRGPKILRGFDEDLRDRVQANLKAAGVQVITNTIFTDIQKTSRDFLPLDLTLKTGTKLMTDCVFMAVGRVPALEGLGLEKAGLETGKRGEIPVDEYSKTGVDNIWAVGDVTRRAELTPVALREGHAFADTEFGGTPRTMDHTDIATAVFTQPEVGTIGLAEHDAREMYGDVDIYKSDFRPMKNVLSNSTERVFMKLIVKQDDQRVVGAHIIGPDAGEMIQMLAIAIKMGATKQQLDETCAVHPTMAEELVTMRNKWVGE